MTERSVQRLVPTCFFAALAAITPLAVAQEVTVSAGGEKIVVDGDTVRIEGAGGVTEVESDWRGVRVETDTEQILVDLGAVVVEDRIRLDLAGDILFDFDSSAIQPEAAAQLGQVAHVIRDRSVGEVYVIGHTDSVGNDAYNKKLSQERAVAVMSWLSRNEGIPTAVMVGSGMGSSRPVAHNTMPDGSDNPEGRAQNRRVEIQMATREGVAIGPDVIIAPGGVRISESGVSVGGGAIEVDAGGVSVGGVRVDAGGVTVGEEGGVTVTGGGASGARIVSDEAPAVCGSGEECSFACQNGDCRMRCESGAVCDFSCDGGDCFMTASAGARADFSCSGGDCKMDCEPGAECAFSCSGGDCRFGCPAGAGCNRISCSGDDCVCSGAAC